MAKKRAGRTTTKKTTKKATGKKGKTAKTKRDPKREVIIT